MQNVSVIIRTYTLERWPLLLAALDSVRQQTCPPTQTVVVVDHNRELQSRVRGLPGVTAVPNDEARGSSGGWNTGIKAASGSILAFIDDDAVAAPDWLEQLQLGYRRADVAGVGGAVVPVWLGGRPAWFPREFNWVVGCTPSDSPRAESAVRNLTGCNMSFRREVLEGAGPFRGAENGIGHLGALPIGCDETELCIRIRQRWPGKLLVLRPQAKVYHHVPSTRATWRYFRNRCYYEGRSKARVARLVGRRAATETELTYVLTTLLKGLARGVCEVLAGDLTGPRRAAAIVAGLSAASWGFAAETVRPAAFAGFTAPPPLADERELPA